MARHDTTQPKQTSFYFKSITECVCLITQANKAKNRERERERKEKMELKGTQQDQHLRAAPFRCSRE